jgi:hypothetical protein
MPTIEECVKHAEELSRLKDLQCKYTKVLEELKVAEHPKRPPLYFYKPGFHDGSELAPITKELSPEIYKAAQKLLQDFTEKIALMEDPLFMVGEAPESQVNRKIEEEKQKYENDNTNHLRTLVPFSYETLVRIKEHFQKYPQFYFAYGDGVKLTGFGQSATKFIGQSYCIPDLLKEHGL